MSAAKAKFNPKVDAYIASAPAFAKPILEYIRDAVHQGCPQAEEVMKWSRPHFDYKGMICGMSAFKEHCALGFWKGSLIIAAGDNKNIEAAGQFGRITSINDLPSKKQIATYVRAAVKLNEEGVKSPTMTNRKPRAPIATPKELTAALKKNAKARETFANLSPSQQRDYNEWLTEAKTDETRQRRLETTLEWLAEGKPRHWKYMKK